MLATDNGGEMLLTTSTLQIVLFKYAKGVSRKLNSAWQASRFSSKILRLLRVGNENMMVEKIICNQSDQNISTNVYHALFFSKQITAWIVSKAA